MLELQIICVVLERLIEICSIVEARVIEYVGFNFLDFSFEFPIVCILRIAVVEALAIVLIASTTTFIVVVVTERLICLDVGLNVLVVRHLI
jgi:hypothetical protein